MADIKSYSLWLQRLNGPTTQSRLPRGFPVSSFAILNSHMPGTGSSGPGHAKFDTLDLTVTESGYIFAQMTNARNSSAYLGRGRLDAVLSSGCSRPLLDFEDAVVLSVQATDGRNPSVDLQLSIDNLRVHWRPAGS